MVPQVSLAGIRTCFAWIGRNSLRSTAARGRLRRQSALGRWEALLSAPIKTKLPFKPGSRHERSPAAGYMPMKQSRLMLLHEGAVARALMIGGIRPSRADVDAFVLLRLLHKATDERRCGAAVGWRWDGGHRFRCQKQQAAFAQRPASAGAAVSEGDRGERTSDLLACCAGES